MRSVLNSILIKTDTWPAGWPYSYRWYGCCKRSIILRKKHLKDINDIWQRHSWYTFLYTETNSKKKPGKYLSKCTSSDYMPIDRLIWADQLRLQKRSGILHHHCGNRLKPVLLLNLPGQYNQTPTHISDRELFGGNSGANSLGSSQ